MIPKQEEGQYGWRPGNKQESDDAVGVTSQWSGHGQIMQGLVLCAGVWSLFQGKENEGEAIRFFKISLATELRKDLARIITFTISRGIHGLAMIHESHGLPWGWGGDQNKDCGSVRRQGKESESWQAATQYIMAAFLCQHI